ncbi:nectin-2 isoform X1 [Pelobates cultripes]|uniref:Nectin-2 isoform X1 n=1 Tax=Pelobates cultripes TaxID=61616 RepID=A0AAD1WN63_PELCU|nr:nectin-2 isoform X1 [Pelobates cultripes]
MQWQLTFLLIGLCEVLQAQELRVNDKVTGNLLQEALLPCSFVSADQNARVSQAIWFKDGANIAAYSPALGIKVKDSDRIQFVNPSDTSTPLRITKLLASDEGKYTCEVSIFPEGNFKGTTQLNVQAVPQNSANVVQVVAGDQEMTVATCTSANGRPPAQITWQTSVPGNVTTDMTNNTDGTYTLISNYRITPTWTADGEKITCTVTHDGKETAIPLKLSVQYTPVVTIEGYDDNWHLNRKGASLTCNAQGNPPPTIFKWTTANGSPLPPSVHVNGKILYVDQMDENVNTTFKCEVTNAIGSRASQQEVLVREKPNSSGAGTTGGIIGGIIAAIVAVAVVATVLMICRQQRKNRTAKEDEEFEGPPAYKPPPPTIKRPTEEAKEEELLELKPPIHFIETTDELQMTPNKDPLPMNIEFPSAADDDYLEQLNPIYNELSLPESASHKEDQGFMMSPAVYV